MNLQYVQILHILPRMVRNTKPRMPEDALREAIINALAHRDYLSTANTQIYLFQDCVEFVNLRRISWRYDSQRLGNPERPT